MLPRLIALTPGHLVGDDLEGALRMVHAALGAGLPGLLLREPRLNDRQWLRLGTGIDRLRRDLAPGTWLGVHDRAHLARAVRADGLHLGFRSLTPAVARAQLSSRAPVIGRSSHAGDAPETWTGADYLFHSPVLASPSKRPGAPDALQPIGFDGLAQAVQRAQRPVFGLGGLGPEHARAVLESGAHGLAVLSGILGHRDPAARTRSYLTEIEAALDARGESR